MRHFYLILALMVVIIYPSLAGDYLKDDPGFILRNLKQKKYSIDTSAAAIVLYEKISYDLYGYTGVKSCKIRRIIRIMNKGGIELADVDIPVYSSAEHYSRIRKVSGTTYNLVDTGIEEHDLDWENIAKDKFLNERECKFSMPAVQEGSIVDYTFEVDEDLTTKFGDWPIQDNIPKLYTAFSLSWPEQFRISSLNVGTPTFQIVDDEEAATDTTYPDAYSYMLSSGGQLKQKWVRKNVPAIEAEPMMSSIDNFKERMKLFITGVETTMYLNTWDKINKHLLESKYFYKAIDEDDEAIVAQTRRLVRYDTGAVEKARKIFAYVRDSIASHGTHGTYAKQDAATVLEHKSGSPTEVNLLLVSMLRAARLTCNPVILSTTENGLILELYPDDRQFNYTVCEVKVNGSKYYLDASGKYNPFGVLPDECYNGYARVINEKGESVRLIANMAKEKGLYTIATTNNNIDSYALSFKFTFGDFSALELRTKWNDDSANIKHYLADQVTHCPFPAHLKNYVVNNLHTPDKSLSIEFVLNVDWPKDGSIIYVSPYFHPYFNNSPFKSEKRKFLVNLPYGYNIIYDLKLKLPDNYSIDELPKPMRINFDDNIQTQDITMYDPASNVLVVNSQTIILETAFATTAYPELKDFFDKMIAEQKKTLVIKKRG